MIILTVISFGINSHEPFPCGLIRQSKSQASLTFHNDYKMDKPYKSHHQGAHLPQYLYYGDSGGSSFFPSSRYSSSTPHRITCNLIPPWPPASYISIFYIGVYCTGDSHRVSVDTGSARPTPPPGSTLAVSLP